LLQPLRQPAGRTAVAALFLDGQRFAEANRRPPHAVETGGRGSQNILLKLIDKLGHALDARLLDCKIVLVAEQLHHKAQIIEFVTGRLPARVLRG
jgi:hypothetical protein